MLSAWLQCCAQNGEAKPTITKRSLAGQTQGVAETTVVACRVTEAADKQPCGVAGTVEHVAKAELSTQPICSFDWSPDRLGLFACAALDQSLYVGITTNLQTA